MPHRRLLVLIVFIACGCALTAKKPPTPAAELSGEDLARLPKNPDERYFLILFGSQDALRLPQYTHTWATIVRVNVADCGPGGVAAPGYVDPVLDVHTISWLPTKGTIDALSRTVEPGRNYTLHETMKFAVDTNQSVAFWGPYEVWRGFYHRFLVQKEFLDSGAIGYQCIDSRGEAARLGNGSDCIHAVTDMDPIYPRLRYPLLDYGKQGTAHLVRRLMRSPIWFDPHRTHDWLIPRLGLSAYRPEQRHYLGRAEEHDRGTDEDLDDVGSRFRPPEPK